MLEIVVFIDQGLDLDPTGQVDEIVFPEKSGNIFCQKIVRESLYF